MLYIANLSCSELGSTLCGRLADYFTVNIIREVMITHKCAHAHAHTYSLAHTHSYTYSRTQIVTVTDTYTRTQIYTVKDTCFRFLKRTCSQNNAQTLTNFIYSIHVCAHI